MVTSPQRSTFALRVEDVPRMPAAHAGRVRNAFTVDVEDWYQSCIDFDAPITDRVVRNVDRMLSVLDDCGVKGTFFVQGRVAETFPGLIRSLSDLGHEVQSHGHTHRPLSAMSRSELHAELDRGKKTVEDASGTAVTAFRAPDFSIGRENLWAFGVLADVGFDVDSSIFPMRSRHYGVASWEVAPHHLVFDSRRILEVPVATGVGERPGFPSRAAATCASFPGACSSTGCGPSRPPPVRRWSTAIPTSSRPRSWTTIRRFDGGSGSRSRSGGAGFRTGSVRSARRSRSGAWTTC